MQPRYTVPMRPRCSFVRTAIQFRCDFDMKPLRRDTRAISPAGMFGGKAPLRLAAHKRRPYMLLAPMRSTPAFFLDMGILMSTVTQRAISGPTHTHWAPKPRTLEVLFCLVTTEERTQKGECGTFVMIGHISNPQYRLIPLLAAPLVVRRRYLVVVPR
jgi:hypothetical protein